MAVIDGTPGNDTIYGTDDADEIDAGDGNDLVVALDGNDIVNGGGGSDRINGGGGDDVIDGGAGGDILYGGFGNDILYGRDGNDTLFGNTGDDTLYGGTGNDQLYGQEGNDTIFGEDGDDTIYYLAGNDVIDGGAGSDTLIADFRSNDFVLFDADSGTLTSDAGGVLLRDMESFWVEMTGTGDAVMFGSANSDRLISDAGDDFLEGRGGDDALIAGEGNNFLYGGDGDDFLSAGSGNDTISGGNGNDLVTTGGGTDQLDGGAGVDGLRYGDGSDISNDTVLLDPDGGSVTIGGAVSSLSNFEFYIFTTGNGDDSLVGGDLADHFATTGGNNYIEARGGDDFIYVVDGNNYIDAGDGDDRIWTGEGNDIVIGGAGDDYIRHAGGVDAIDGGDGLDFLFFQLTNFAEERSPDVVILDTDRSLFQVGDVVSSIDNVEQFRIDAGTGDDVLIGGIGDDTFSSFEGDDYIEGRGGNDVISALTGNDYVDGGDGDDRISVFLDGTDVILGGAGDDTIGYSFNSFYDSDLSVAITAVIDGGDGTDSAQIFLIPVEGDMSLDLVSGAISWDGGSISVTNVESFLIYSGSGDDVLVASGGSALWDARGGFDEFVLPGSYADYQLTIFQVGFVAYFENEAGTLYASTAEIFTFDDGVFDLATGTFTPTEVTNNAPDAVDDTGAADEDGATSGNVLANDSDADGDAIEVTTVNGLPVGTAVQGVYGTLTVAADGSYTYVADGKAADRLPDGTSGDDVFTYEVTDGEDSSTATLTITVSAISDGRFVVGTEGNDVLPGGDGNDVIDGLGGDDRLLGGDGDDCLDGGAGNDRINAGDGNDHVVGGDGNDILFGNDGDDVIVGGNGDDLMVGHEGADTFVVGGDAGSVDTIRDFEIGVDSLELAGEAQIDAILHNADGAQMSLSDCSTVIFNGISAADLAVMLSENAQMDALFAQYTGDEPALSSAPSSPSNLAVLLDMPVAAEPMGLAPSMSDPLDQAMIADQTVM